ncbi:MAG: hypothetical protein U0269_29865 [Polyangiales bacterium]
MGSAAEGRGADVRGGGAIDTRPESTWEWLIDRRAARDRALTRVLPYRIGITSRPDGTWSDYVHHEVLYDLPAVVADVMERDISQRDLQHYRRAHHLAGFYGLLTDRVADGQVFQDRALEREAVWLRREWESALSIACNSGAKARRWIADERRLWKLAVSTPCAQIDAPSTYGKLVRDKVGHLWLSSGMMLDEFGANGATVAMLRDSFERVMIALQCHDDAADQDEDRALRGASATDLLGVDASTLHATAALLLREVATRPLPVKMRSWCEAMSAQAFSLIEPERSVAAGVGAALLTASIVGASVSEAAATTGSPSPRARSISATRSEQGGPLR